VSDLVAFLKARLGEDENTAKIAQNTPGEQSLAWCLSSDLQTPVVKSSPVRALAEVEAKRRIIEEHAENRYGDCRICGGSDSCGCMSGSDHPCDTLRLLALPYAWHPEYRQEWKP
jgi:hypothetical protein